MKNNVHFNNKVWLKLILKKIHNSLKKLIVQLNQLNKIQLSLIIKIILIII